LAKWASNNGQIIKSGLPNDRRAKFLPSVVGFAYDLLRYECYLGNIGTNDCLYRWVMANDCPGLLSRGSKKRLERRSRRDGAA
ncbi:MAG: hypothetical protein QF398_09715, partial [Alphaproteobacteria bacterium]|nr:hypothetical protein [Alphaproteobacteria bacterium]